MFTETVKNWIVVAEIVSATRDRVFASSPNGLWALWRACFYINFDLF